MADAWTLQDLEDLDGVRDFWVSEEVQVVRFGFKPVFYIVRLEPEGEKGGLTRYWLVLHDVVAGRALGVSEGLGPYSVVLERCSTPSRAGRVA